MRKQVTLAVLLAATLAAGCGGSDSNDDGGQAAAATTPTTTTTTPAPPVTGSNAFLTRVNEVIATPDAGSASPVDTTGIDAAADNSGDPQVVRRPG